MTYEIFPTPAYVNSIETHKKHGNKKLLAKIERFIDELAEHPRTGTGKVERLKHYQDREVYSRRINREHRLIYEVIDDKIIVVLISAYGHYDD